MSDTDRSPFPPEEEMAKDPKEARHDMSDRELLLSLHDRLDAQETRLAEGDRLFQVLQADSSLLVNWTREIALTRDRHDIVAQIDAEMEKRSTAANGHALHDEPTNPGRDAE